MRCTEDSISSVRYSCPDCSDKSSKQTDITAAQRPEHPSTALPSPLVPPFYLILSISTLNAAPNFCSHLHQPSRPHFRPSIAHHCRRSNHLYHRSSSDTTAAAVTPPQPLTNSSITPLAAWPPMLAFCRVAKRLSAQTGLASFSRTVLSLFTTGDCRKMTDLDSHVEWVEARQAS